VIRDPRQLELFPALGISRAGPTIVAVPAKPAPVLPDMARLERELAAARQELHNLQIMQMKPGRSGSVIRAIVPGPLAIVTTGPQWTRFLPNLIFLVEVREQPAHEGAHINPPEAREPTRLSISFFLQFSCRTTLFPV